MAQAQRQKRRNIWVSQPYQTYQLPGLLHANHQIRTEAAPVYYSINTFTFQIVNMNLHHYYSFLEELGAHSQLIRHVILDLRGRGGSLDFVRLVTVEEKHLSRECRIENRGQSNMARYLDRGMAVAERLHDMGLKWDDVAEAMGDMWDLMAVTGGEYGLSDWAADNRSECCESSTDERDWTSECDFGDQGGK